MKFLTEAIKGILIGIANIIPGVSGGTMAVSMGIYDKIIGSITNLFKDFRNSVKTLFPYLIGMAAGIIGLAFIIEFLFEKYPLPTSMIFIGLILGGIPILFGKVKGKKRNIADYAVFIVFFVLIIAMQFMQGSTGKEATLTVGFASAAVLFIIGVLASATMVIPGVSGSMILMIIGYYEPIIEMINHFIKSFIKFDIPALLHDCGILVPFGIGVVAGIFIIAKIIEFLLSKYESTTYHAILGLVIASPIAILLNTDMSKNNIAVIIVSAVTFIIGFGVAFLLGKEG